VRPPVSRAVRWAGALALAVIVAVAVFGSGGPEKPPEPVAPVVGQTQFGPLTPSDVDLLVKVRQAGLWEIPTGQQMQQRASRGAVAEVGRLLATEHTELDAITRRTADQLGVTLPSQPSAQQQGWMEQISAARGPDYDRTAITLLRLAHGNVLPVVAQARSSTRNDLVRDFATTTATFVMRHHEYLESTGLVDFGALPQPAAAGTPPPPQLAANGTAAPTDGGGLGAVVAAVRDASLSSYLAAGVAFAAVIGAGALLDMAVQSRSRPGPRAPAPGHPAQTYPAPPPFPGPPPPPRARPRGPQASPSRRFGGPAALVILLVALLAVPPIMNNTVSRPESPTRSAAMAAGFAALDPAPDHVLALAAASRDTSNRDDSDDSDDSDNGSGDDNGADDRDDDNGDDGADGGNERNNNEQDNAGNDEENNARNDDGGNDLGGNDRGGDAGDGQNDEEEFPGREDAGPPGRNDFVDIGDVTDVLADPATRANASTGSYVADCGSPDPAVRNSDNWIAAPGKVNGAQHMHDYVGAASTDAFTSAGDLLESRTTCAFEDQSTFFWPVLRDTSGVEADANDDGGGLDGNVGEILEPAQVVLQFMGNATSRVEPMPQLLRVITGDAKAITNGDQNVRAQWTCRGFEDRATTEYPLCPGGSRLLRVLDFPSCWDGERLDSEDHRSHITFPDEDTGVCPSDNVPVPQLRMILAYDQPSGRTFALDSFPDQQHHPSTDHGDFVNGMPPGLMDDVVECINEGLQC
jgi:predicted outer membrane protein